MDDEDFRALIKLLQGELRAAGAADIADERHYFRLDVEVGEPRLHDPQKRLIEMLRAFERKLAVEDRETYHRALGRMNDTLPGEGPKGAVLELARETDRDAVIIDLGAAPELGELRREAHRLIEGLLERRLPPRSLA